MMCLGRKDVSHSQLCRKVSLDILFGENYVACVRYRVGKPVVTIVATRETYAVAAIDQIARVAVGDRAPGKRRGRDGLRLIVHGYCVMPRARAKFVSRIGVSAVYKR